MRKEIRIRIKFQKDLDEREIEGLKIAFSKQMDLLLGVIKKGRKTVLGKIPPIDPGAEYIIEND